jgi:hypothetical protein
MARGEDLDRVMNGLMHGVMSGRRGPLMAPCANRPGGVHAEDRERLAHPPGSAGAVHPSLRRSRGCWPVGGGRRQHGQAGQWGSRCRRAARRDCIGSCHGESVTQRCQRASHDRAVDLPRGPLTAVDAADGAGRRQRERGPHCLSGRQVFRSEPRGPQHPKAVRPPSPSSPHRGSSWRSSASDATRGTCGSGSPWCLRAGPLSSCMPPQVCYPFAGDFGGMLVPAPAFVVGATVTIQTVIAAPAHVVGLGHE